MQLKDGTAARVAACTLLAREVVDDIENYQIFIGNCTTAGDKPFALASAAKWTTSRTLTLTGQQQAQAL